MRLEQPYWCDLISYSQANFREKTGKIATNFYPEITLLFPIIITNCEKLFLTCQQHRSTLRVVTPIWPPLASIMAYQMRDPVN